MTKPILSAILAAGLFFGTAGTADARTPSQTHQQARAQADRSPQQRPDHSASRRVTSTPERHQARAPVRTPPRVQAHRVRRGGAWVYTVPNRLSIGSLIWIGNRPVDIIRVRGNRALVEYPNGTRTWVWMGR